LARVEKSIDVELPVGPVYNQWTQFEDFPSFMEGVEAVQQVDERHLHWRASVGGSAKEWDAEIREQVPDSRIIWQNTSGAENAGIVRFEPVAADRTRVYLQMSYDPEGMLETAGDKLGFMSRRVEGDLERFKKFVESSGGSGAGWRGEIKNERVPDGHTRGEPRMPNDR
jgi:uncharacterized membrane protein